MEAASDFAIKFSDENFCPAQIRNDNTISPQRREEREEKQKWENTLVMGSLRTFAASASLR
jgi:hypothetical protein